MYLSLMMDRASKGPIIVACASGGTSIEDLAESDPDQILKEKISMDAGLTDAQAEKIATFLKLEPGSKVFNNVSALHVHVFFCTYSRVCAVHLQCTPLSASHILSPSGAQ